MPIIKIDDQDYELDTLSDEAKSCKERRKGARLNLSAILLTRF